MPSSCAIASAQIVFPVPGGPAKLNASPSPVACRSPSPHRPKISAWLRTCPSACCVLPPAEPPPAEDQRVAAHLHERVLERAQRRRRQDHVGEGALRRDGLDGAAA